MNEHMQPKPDEQCLDAGLLIGLRDEELTAAETAQVNGHLATCTDCAEDQRTIANYGQEVYTLLDTLRPQTEKIPATATAFAALKARLDGVHEQDNHHEALHTLPVQGKRLVPLNRRYRRYGGATIAAAAILVALIVLTAASPLVSQFLSLFRPQQFQAVSVDPRQVVNQLWSYLDNFSDVQDHPDTTIYPANPTKAQVEQYTKFQLLLPDQLPSGVGHAVKLNIINGQEGIFTFDATKARAYLQKTGQGSIHIPAQLDGAVFDVTLAPSVTADYYTGCTQNGHAAVQCSGGTPFSISEISNPVIQTSGKNSLNDLRDFFLSLPKLSPKIRTLLQHTDQNSGVVPVPIPSEANAQDVTVQGAKGLLVTESSLGGVVFWQAHNIIYMLTSTITDGPQLLAAARSLH